MSAVELTRFVKDLAAEVGFDRCGICRAAPIGRADYVRKWLGSGRAGSMKYLHRHFNERVDPRGLLVGAKSVIVVALLYHQPGPAPRRDSKGACNGGSPGGYEKGFSHQHEKGFSQQHQNAYRSGPAGRIARYAWGDDYHGVVKTKLWAMVDQMRAELPDRFEAKAFVDTAPLVERELAAAAGVGWIGKNTMVLDRRLGSYFFLGALVTTLEPAPDEPETDHCGTCTACLDACPTKALTAPYEMDASRCISYLTIERRGPISPEFHAPMGDWIFGCDVCQEVCPFNRKAPATREPRFAIRSPGPRPLLDEILGWSIEEYRADLRGSAIKRAKLDMLQRNARIALDNARRASKDPAS